MPDHNYFANLIWQIADLLRGPYRPPQYERVMLPMTVLRRFDCVLAPTKTSVLAEHGRWGSKLEGEALDAKLNKTAGQRFHNHSPLDFEKLKGDPDSIAPHLASYIHGFSANVRRIFEYFEFEAEEDARIQHPVSGRLQVLRCGSAPGRGAERSDGADLREPHPPLQ
jgi:type I restriction enzyme M protein